LRAGRKTADTNGAISGRRKVIMIGKGSSLFLALAIGVTAPAAWGQSSISACPYTITTSGSYVVTRNLNSVGTCIAIQADNVAIDLQGHKITGNGTGFGITDGRVNENIVIANGTIEKFSGGIEVNLSYPVTITGVTAQQNARRGVELFGATVVRSKIDNNGAFGIRINGDVLSLIVDSEVNGNGTSIAFPDEHNGIETLSGPTVVINSEANSNAATGIALSVIGGILTPGNQVIETQANGNGGNGIDLSAEAGNSVTASTALRNGGAGILLACPGAAASNTAKLNGSGNLVEVPGSAPCANVDNTAP
jgi:hypothetical protein